VEAGAGIPLLWAAPHAWTLPLSAVITWPLPEGCSRVLVIHAAALKRQASGASFYGLGIKKSGLKIG